MDSMLKGMSKEDNGGVQMSGASVRSDIQP